MESESDTKKDEQDTSTKSTYFIAVHVGAGYHSPLRSQSYMTAMKDACNAAASILAKNGSALDAVVAALISLEDSPITNAGKGSNLTEDGRVECDASVMESQRGAEGNNGAFAAVGAVRGVKNPILLASSLLQEEKKGRLPLGRIRPIFLVGEGAREWAIEHDVPVVSEEQMLTEDSRKIWKEHRKKVDDEGIVKKRDREDRVENRENKNEFYDIFDTVGAICMDCNGHVATGVSSGGVSLKHKGRAAHYGSGCFVYEDGESVKPTAACTTSGAGEQVMKAMLAYECVKQLVAQENADDAIKYTLESHFLELNGPFKVESRFGGLIALKVDPKAPNKVEFLYGHTTESMGIGYHFSGNASPKVFVSRLSEKTGRAGRVAHLGGVHINLE